MTYANESEVQLKHRKKAALKSIGKYKIKPVYMPLVNGQDIVFNYLVDSIKAATTIYEVENILDFAEYRKSSIKVAKELCYSKEVIINIINSKNAIQLNNILRGARLHDR